MGKFIDLYNLNGDTFIDTLVSELEKMDKKEVMLVMGMNKDGVKTNIYSYSSQLKNAGTYDEKAVVITAMETAFGRLFANVDFPN